MKYIYSSEAVTEGHPDKVADRIADAILDELFKVDKYSRVACEVTTFTNLVFIFGEITTNAKVNYKKIARKVIEEIGYTKSEYGFSAKKAKIVVKLHKQSSNIALGVDEKEGKGLGAGDQGIMFGYATNETEEYMPISIDLAQKLAMKLAEVRKNNTIHYLRPDGKTQVSVEYENDKVKRIDTILISTQHDENVSVDTIKEDLIKHVINEVIPAKLIDKKTKILVNPTGLFVIGGPAGDSGLTGRKLIVDTYGGVAHQGGGALSGKDPTKVDRSAAYMLRYIAKNIVASGLADKFELQVAYAIGVSEPVSLLANSYGTGKVSDEKLVEIVKENFDLTPSGIIDALDLRRPIYKETSCYGHFGRKNKDFTWEALDKVETLKKYLN